MVPSTRSLSIRGLPDRDQKAANSERFAEVRVRDPRIAQAYEVLALELIIRFVGQSRHASGRFPGGVAILHVIVPFASREACYTVAANLRTQLFLNVKQCDTKRPSHQSVVRGNFSL